ncbi:unnamed protein product [Diabrotica balteata]|uniref:Multidrug resistance-associated protein lethal(2)03659 n=1 Tax=Diabrotica balteata TaxID=107213 RepID=A0A9N9XDL0_DIABA|nr:unnamed protein product [Diabrotica balteata]
MDHCEKVQRPPHPRENANIFSLLTFGYTGKLFTRGFKQDLEDDDLYDVIKKCRSKKCTDKLEHQYNSRSKTKDSEKKVSIFKIIWHMYGLRYILLGLFHMSGRLLTTTLEPDALSHLVGYFKPGQTKMTIHDAMYFAGIMIGVKAFHTIYFQNYHIYLTELALQIRISFSSLIYRKALKLSPKALENTSLGNIVTVINKDVQQFEHSIWMFNDLWISVLQTFVMCYLIYQRTGVASVVAILMLVLVIPVQGYVAKIIKHLRIKMSRRTDERLQRTQESLSTIKTIKMYTWEEVFAEKIGEARFKELKILIKSTYSKISLMIMSSLVGKFAFYAMLMIYLYIHEDMSAEDIFYIMRIFGTLRFTISLAFSMGFTRIGELSASLKRINHILELEELPDVIDKPDDDPQIDLRNVSVNLKNKDILTNVNLKLEKGLNVLTGQLGSGKSSLIKVVLRDYPILDGGEVRTRGRKSYASQDPWLFPSSIKQNILFGEKYDYKKYQQVVSACALEYDFKILEKGDETIVADRGMNLSKGQQARINLARAIYRDSDIYLIDDALTALDTRVQEQIFTQCIQGLLKDKCVVLVTHNTKHIHAADKLVILHDGVIKYIGDQANATEDILLEAIEDEEIEELELQTNETEPSKVITEKTELLEKPQLRKRQVYHENKKQGSVDFDLYMQYIKMGGGFIFAILLMFTFAGATITESTSQKMLTNWINEKSTIQGLREKHLKNTSINFEDIDLTNQTAIYYNSTYNISAEVIRNIGRLEVKATKSLNLYTILVIGYSLVELLKRYIILRVGFKASVNLHKKMVKSIMHSTMAFFDSFFIGNILNRFSQDLSIVDEHLAMMLAHMVDALFHLFGVVGLIATINWKFIIPAVILAIFSILLRSVYIRTSRSLKRLEAATRSPLVGHLNSTMEGLTTIRAYKAQDILKNEFDRHQDLFSSAFYTSICAKAAFSFLMEISSIAFTTTVIVRFLFFDTGTNSGDVGLTLNQAGMLSGIVHMGLAAWSELENSMTSVERAMEYTTIESESSSGTDNINWPTKGEIVYQDVSMTYTNSHEKVLKDISFTVKAGTKIGIVGRTGAGKSSIISTLYRLYNYEGKILVDGVELKQLSLKFLRQHISIIPQDPIMFSGTIRSNIDPLNEFSDEDIWKTLHKVQLDSVVPKLEVDVDDVNFSTGQRQLICLARAIIRKNKIMVLDEATANMDPETEQVAQKIIEENFSSCTVLIIAHRLDAILDCDKILVLDKGNVIEFDSPKALLENKTSLFSEMMRNSHLGHGAEKEKSN